MTPTAVSVVLSPVTPGASPSVAPLAVAGEPAPVASLPPASSPASGAAVPPSEAPTSNGSSDGAPSASVTSTGTAGASVAGQAVAVAIPGAGAGQGPTSVLAPGPVPAVPAAPPRPLAPQVGVGVGAPRGAAALPADDPSSSDDTDDEDPYSGLDDKLFDALPQFVSSLAPVDEVTTELAYAPQSLDAFDKVEVSVLIANATQGDTIAFHSVLRRLEKSKATLLWEANLCQAEAAMRDKEVRTDPVGMDRLGQLYFLLGATSPRLFVVPVTEFTAPPLTGTPPVPWRSYDSPLDLRRLLMWLSAKGRQESRLKDVLHRHQAALEGAMIALARVGDPANFTQEDPLRFRPRSRPRAATVPCVPADSSRCSFCCDVFNPTTQRHCPWSHVTVDLSVEWDEAVEKARVLAALAAGASPSVAGVVEAIGAREAARQAGRHGDVAPDTAFDTLMAIKCDLIDVEAAVPWETLNDPAGWSFEKRAQWLCTTRLAITVDQLLYSLFQLEVVLETDETVPVGGPEGAAQRRHSPWFAQWWYTHVPSRPAAQHVCTQAALATRLQNFEEALHFTRGDRPAVPSAGSITLTRVGRGKKRAR